MRRISYVQAIREAIDEEMQRDPAVFVLGEDIGKAYGGPFGEFRGLFDKYGANRVRQTPISETAILGCAIGAAATGMRPIASIMFGNFLAVCADDLVNQLQIRYMSGGQLRLPLTICCTSGAGTFQAHQHSRNLFGWLMANPGLKIVAASTPYDLKGLLKSAIRDESPVISIHHMTLILGNLEGEVPDDDYTIPLGCADVKREGSDVTIVATSMMVHRALVAANRLESMGISTEVVDTRTLVPLDKQTILDSVMKTGRIVIVDEDPKTGSASGEIAAIVAEEAFRFLRAPIARVCAPDTPVPFSKTLENSWLPDQDKIIEATMNTIEYT